MKKHPFLLTLLVLVAVIGLSAAGYVVWQELQKETIYIAVAGIMSGEYQIDGESTLAGVRLYLEALNKSGGLPGKRIKLLVYDDQDDPAVAVQVAERIAQENKVLLVIGHQYSMTSIAAGEVYRKYEIPVITASATAEGVTRGNPWSFRVIPNNQFIGMFVANYMKYALNIRTASVIAVNDAYGQSLSTAFRSTASQIGLQLLDHWALNDEEYSDDEIAKVVGDLRSQEPGAIFLAAYGVVDDARMVVALREAGIQSLLIGSESFADPIYFNEQFEGLPEAQHPATDYTNGMYTVSLFTPEIVGKEGIDFVRAYMADYPIESLYWISPCYYDAMRVVVEAISRADLKGERYIRHDRKQVRDILAGLYAPPNHSVKGVSGEIFFDADRNANRPLAMSVYHDNILLPAFTQYQQLSNMDRFPDRVQAVLAGDLMMINNQFLTRTQVVRTGIQVHEVRQFDPINNQYTLDFSLWLRFPKGLNPTDILFLNALTPIRLEEPVFSETPGSTGITTQIHRLEGVFTNVVDLQHYPFDQQVLTITFRHASRMLEELIYVPDRSGIPEFLQQSEAPPIIPPEWTLQATETYQNVAQHTMPTATTPYSEFHFDLRVARQKLPFMFGSLVLLLCGFFGIMMALPEDRIIERLLLGGGIVIGAIIVQFALAPGGRVTTILDLEYVVLALYLLDVFGIFWAVSAYYFYYTRLSIIKRIPLFASLSRADQSFLSKKMKRYHYRKPDKIVIRQGDPGESLFLIVDGEVAFWVQDEQGDSHEVNHFSAGQFFGEMALLTGKPRTATAITVRPTRLGEINRQHLIPLLRKRPDLVETMADEMAYLDIKYAQRRNMEHAQQLDQAVLGREYAEAIIRELHLAGDTKKLTGDP